MRMFLDTSVLVASFWGDHPRHEASLSVFLAWDKKQSSCAAHSLAEVYAVMTRLPVKPPIAPEQVMLFLEDIQKRLTIITLAEDEYYSAIQEAAERGITGGRVYDVLLLRCAVKSKAETIFTWNLADFQRSSPDLADRIHEPSAARPSRGT